MFKYVALLVLAVLAQNSLAQQQRVPVSLYYEALCPDSIKFFIKQLYPTLQKDISKHIDLRLIPYGKATKTYNETAGIWEFDCRHGPNECYTDKIQACAIAKIDGGKPSQNLGYNKVTLAFVNCLMDKVKTNPFSLPTSDCASMNNVPNLSEIENCANHTDGSKFLAELGHITEALNPKLSFVPTVTFHNVYNKADNDLSQVNFLKALCGHVKDNNLAECKTSGASSFTMNTIVTLAVTVSSVLATLRNLF